jgi:hypothetical protein
MFVLQINSDGVKPVMENPVKLLDIVPKIIGKVGQSSKRVEMSMGHVLGKIAAVHFISVCHQTLIRLP